MEHWCRLVPLVLCLASIAWSGAKADDENFKNHSCTFFYHLDFDGNLVLTIDDFVNMFYKTVVKDETLTVNGTAYTPEQMDALSKEAAKYFALTDESQLEAILTGDGLSLKDFLASMTERRFTRKFASQIEDLVTFMHEIIDVDDGDIDMTLAECSIICSVLRIEESDVPAGFDALDVNGDGKMTVQEDLDGAMKYFNDAPLNDRSDGWSGPTLTCASVSKNDPSNLP